MAEQLVRRAVDAFMARDLAARHHVDQPRHRLPLVHRVGDHPLEAAGQADRLQRLLVRDAVRAGVVALVEHDLVVAQVARIARHTAGLIDVGREVRDEEIVLDERSHAGTYGIPDEQTLEAIRLAGRLEGMLTDPVYEGKSMAGLIDLVSRGEIDRDATVLYAHLGGQPALSAYAALFTA